MCKTTNRGGAVERRQRRRSTARARKDASATVATSLRRPRQPQIDLSDHPEQRDGESLDAYVERLVDWHMYRQGYVQKCVYRSGGPFSTCHYRWIQK